jgi:UDP-N-acetylglucosamine acyltransferase
VRGLNLVGLKRAGFKTGDLRGLKKAYQILFRSGAALEETLEQLRESGEELAVSLADFITDSRRGFHRDKS